MRRRGALLGLAAAAALLAAGCRRPPRHPPLPAAATVLALGDSLTLGTGAPADAGWPSVLAASTGWHVVNAGVPGDTAAQALTRLPPLLDEHRPALVLVSIGGNDFLRRLPERETREQVRRIVAAVRAAGATPVLVAIPRPTLAGALTGSLGDHPLYAEIAEAERVPLVAGAWSEVLGDASLRADAIHANAEGYRRFAMRLRERLAGIGLL